MYYGFLQIKTLLAAYFDNFGYTFKKNIFSANKSRIMFIKISKLFEFEIPIKVYIIWKLNQFKSLTKYTICFALGNASIRFLAIYIYDWFILGLKNVRFFVLMNIL
jgi:hypothetical protein